MDDSGRTRNVDLGGSSMGDMLLNWCCTARVREAAGGDARTESDFEAASAGGD
ncbi:BZ3500_MvSof-1268-A1-R1_Chr8-2g10269 [Microbotryum saponariae]|uniref:BZ3500_MvSof-1268-A1-R1_Chr8-2g10269 protein n=1 Tax=Microbotryum saponariae TaxID=289078 RepID=A0A2X0MQC6_9BASI|nr:BZ3500_MvSof-1268-A1-R1_Chr8-2g10269 [Microbotryum saponariae]SDA02067.1 BZ3501_MvSof-1269-A2-R1_Chr8-2g10019 [Microbotryum saponariae]